MRAATREQVVEKLREFVSIESGVPGITEETPLIASGVLDSFLIVSIIAYCEREFSCSFEPDEFEEQHFKTIGALADKVGGHLPMSEVSPLDSTPARREGIR